MPSHEAIVNTMIPQQVEKPIPTRTVSTRTTLPGASQGQPLWNQEKTIKSEAQAPDVAPPAESVRLSPQLTALARKEQAFREREQAFKAKVEAFEARQMDAENYSQLKSKFASKDYSEAEKLGLNYEEYTQYLIEKQNGEDPTTLKFKALEEEIQSLKKSKEESAAQEFEETVAEYQKEIASVIASSPEFPRTKKAKKEDAVLQNILTAWKEDGEELTVEQSAKEVEEHLNELAELLKLEEQKEEEPSLEKLPPPRLGSRTLNQNMAAVGTDPKPLKSLQFLSEAERYAEARRRVLAKQQGKI